jgi:hypothetical protein
LHGFVINAISTSGPDDAKLVMGELMDPRLADVEASRGGWTTPSFFPAAFALGSRGLSGSFPASATSWIALISLYIVNRALQLGIPRVGVARMVLNVGIEGLLGAAPFVGDLFDVVFKANRRNYILLNHCAAAAAARNGLVILTGQLACCNCCGSAAHLAFELAR